MYGTQFRHTKLLTVDFKDISTTKKIRVTIVVTRKSGFNLNVCEVFSLHVVLFKI